MPIFGVDMNDLELLTGTPRIFELNQKLLSVRQIQVKDLNHAAVISAMFQQTQKEKGRDDAITELLADIITLRGFLYFFTEMNEKDIAELRAFDKERELIECILKVNTTYFEVPKKNKKQNKENEMTYFDWFQTLIASGHTHESILEMSYGAFIQYIDVALKYKANAQKDAMTMMRVAYHADAKSFKKIAGG